MEDYLRQQAEMGDPEQKHSCVNDLAPSGSGAFVQVRRWGGNPLRQLPEGLSVCHRSRGARYMLAMGPDP